MKNQSEIVHTAGGWCPDPKRRSALFSVALRNPPVVAGWWWTIALLLVAGPHVSPGVARPTPPADTLPAPNPGSPDLRALPAPTPAFQSPGVLKHLPAFHERLAERMTFPLSWLNAGQGDFAAWQQQARGKVRECLLAPPPTVPFAPIVVAEQDRGTYVARKLVFNLTGDSRVLAYLVVPKASAPRPAVLLLHDHGAKFDLGKEKVIEPWDDPPEKLKSARQWVEKYYGNRFIGDELARRGYVCLATDMLNWSDRGGGGYDGQEKLAANLLQFGTSFAGTIAHEDLRAAEFLATQPEVDANRIAALGLSVGGFRTWQVAALSDRIAAGVSVCWMATRKGLLVPGNNQTTGQSAFTMTHPGLANFLDYPDVASLACPKPMMFLGGRRDPLFPAASVEDAFATLRRVWESQHASAQLETRLYDAPHEFNTSMQDEAFAWLDTRMQPAKEIRFGGFSWKVRSGHGGPGPNAWSQENVWLDGATNLHLKIAHRTGQWSCAEVTSKERLGFGRYQFQTASRIDGFDDHVVLGLFNYPTGDVGPDATHEIDIEFARWGEVRNPLGNFTVWPVERGLKQVTKAFPFTLASDEATHRFTWSRTRIQFQSLKGYRDDNNEELAAWSYAPEPAARFISAQPMPVHLNLWLFQGRPPKDGREVEVILRDFRFTPQTEEQP